MMFTDIEKGEETPVEACQRIKSEASDIPVGVNPFRDRLIDPERIFVINAEIEDESYRMSGEDKGINRNFYK